MYQHPWYTLGKDKLNVYCTNYNLLSNIPPMKELFLFLKERKKWFLLPVIFVMIVVAGIVMLAGHAAVAPFIYAIF